jgi:membrane protein YdbS with pleckstrin-like domain
MENDRKHSLGQRAFLVFLFRRIKFAVFLFLLVFACWYVERWLSQGIMTYVDYATKMLFLVATAYFLMVLFWTFMEYRFYTYTFTHEAFIMTSGYVTRTETAALYHQIQNVNIHRRPLDRFIGVSQIVIFMSGSGRDAPHNKITLPAVGKRKAKLVQKELLVRARRHVVAPEAQFPISNF